VLLSILANTRELHKYNLVDNASHQLIPIHKGNDIGASHKRLPPKANQGLWGHLNSGGTVGMLLVPLADFIVVDVNASIGLHSVLIAGGDVFIDALFELVCSVEVFGGNETVPVPIQWLEYVN
jgi:hypothetical protein